MARIEKKSPMAWMRAGQSDRRALPALALLSLLTATGLLAGCKKGVPKAVHVPDIAQGFDNSPIDSNSLSHHSGHRHHVLNMGAQETMARLESFALRSQTTVTLGQDGRPQSQNISMSVLVRDANGNVHLQTGNAEHSFELVAVSDRAFVRQDRGHLRRKRRQEVDEGEMAEAAASGLRELLQHFPKVTLTHEQSAKWEGRQAYRYDVEMGEESYDGANPQPSLSSLPIQAPSRWLEEAKHPRLWGKLIVDGATGVVVKADVSGSMVITGATGQPMTLTLKAVHTINEIGDVSVVREPKESIAEVRRPVRPRAPLAFYPEAMLSKTLGSQSAAAKASDTSQAQQGEQTPLPEDEELPEE